ncbi:MAG: PGDYG domain-containing protein [Planctomycetota bacterium]
MSKPQLINPDNKLLSNIQKKLRRYKKDKPVWCKQVTEAGIVETLEGPLEVKTGDYLCRGIAGDIWPQDKDKILSKYIETDQTDGEWVKYEPREDMPKVNAAAVSFAFRVINSWGDLIGKPGDFVVQSSVTPEDIWIVSKSIFEASYRNCE